MSYKVESSKSKVGEVLIIYNMIGEEFYRKLSIEHQELTINVSTWQNGIYLITLGEQKTKIIVAH
jgi:hypothetical protein